MAKIKTVISNYIWPELLPPLVSRRIKKELSIPNPAYEDAVKFKRRVHGISKYIRPYVEENGKLGIPRGFINRYLQVLAKEGLEADLVWKTVLYEKKELPSLNLREYQKPWVDKMLSEFQGVGQAPPGSGKTCMALEMYLRLGQPCLWLTHTVGLAEQVAERLFEFSGEEAGFIGAGKVDIKHFTVGLVPTLCRRNLSEYKDLFGLVIVDECFVAGTMVGNTPIEDIKLGDVVDSYDAKTGKMVKRKVVRLFKKVPDALITIRVGEISITCTPNHPIFTKRGKIRADEIALTDEVLIHRKNSNSPMQGMRKRSSICEERAGREERRATNWSRVDSIKVHKQTSDGQFGGVCPGGYVYNFEVEDTHTYTANGLVVGNCHHIPAKTFSEVTSSFNAHYRYGLTATPYRDDGLQDLMFLTMGPIVTTISKQYLRDIGMLMAPTVIRRPTNFNFPYNPRVKKYNYKALEKALGADAARNEIISTDVIVEATVQDNVCIVLVGTIDHGEELMRIISEIIPETGLIHSKQKPKFRKEVRDSFGRGALSVLIATYKMLAEGFDYTPTNRLFLTAPFKSRILIEQACGRIERISEGKDDALVYDYVDSILRVLRDQSEVRLDVYEASNNNVVTIKL